VLRYGRGSIRVESWEDLSTRLGRDQEATQQRNGNKQTHDL
jgi:hypothetical protein